MSSYLSLQFKYMMFLIILFTCIMSLVPFTLSGSLSKANHDTLNKYFGKLINIFAPTKSYYISLDRHMKRDEVMASLRVVVCYFALFTFAIFYIKKQAFCSSNALYDMEQSQDLQETFIYSSLWSYHRINGIGHRTSRTLLIQLLLLLSGDIETCPGLIDRCGSCLKALKKRQSRMVYSQCHLKFHLKCFCSDDSGVICNSCLFNNNTQDGADQDQQDAQRYVIPELSELLSKKGLKILHQNIRGLLANKVSSVKSWMALGTYTSFRSVKHIYPPKAKPRFKFKVTRLLQSQGLLVKVEVLVFIFLHLFPFKDVWISSKRILNASGLKFYFLKPKVF